MKKLFKLIYLMFIAFLLSCNNLEKENINIVSNTNSVYTESQSKTKKGFGRGSSSTAIDYKETLEKSNILAGNNVNISSDKNILVTGSDIYALNNLNIGAKEDLIIASGLEGNSTVRETTKTGLFKLSGKAKTEDNLKYTNVESVVGAEKDVNLNSEKNVSIVASELVAGNDINLKAKENVNILAADDKFKSDKKETKYSVKPFASAKDLKFEAGLKASYSKNKESNFSTKVKGSKMSAQNDVNIESGKNTNIQASTILSKNTNIDTKGELNLLTKDEISINNMSGTEIEAKLSARLDLSGIKDTIDSVVDVVKGLPELPKAINAAVDLASGKDINESLEGNEEGIEEVSRILNGPKSGGVSAGIYASASIEKIKSKTEVKNSIGSNILSKENISLSSEENMKLKQANIQGKNISINSKKDVSIESGISTVNSKASSQSLNGEVNLISGEFNVGGGISKDKSNEKTHTNSKIYGENILIKSEDLTVKGGNIEADKVDIETKNLHIESMQDEAKSKHQAINISVGKSSVGGGIEYGKHEKEWVKKQSSIIGREKAEINVAEKTNIVGAVIGGADTTLRTKELEFTNIEDKEKGYNIGMNASASFSKDKNEKTKVSKSGSASYDAVDRKQINRATIGTGRIIVDGKETSPNINRDESKAQEITKDVSVDKVGVEYSDNRRNWSEVPTIIGDQGLSLGSDLDMITDKIVNKNYSLENKLGSTLYTTAKGVEEVIDNKLGNKFIGIIPTEDTNGGIVRQLVEPSRFFGYGAESVRVKYQGKEENGKFVIVPTIETLTDAGYEEVKKNNPNAPVYMNGVGNTKKDFIEGLAVGTFTEAEINTLKKGGAIDRIGIFNPTNGLIADVLEAGIGLLGIKTGYNLAGNDVKKEFEKRPELMRDFIAHSQGTIKYTAAINDLYKTEEGKKLLREYKEKSLLVGLAITPKMYDDLGRKLDEISDSRDEKKSRISLEKIVNENDIVSGMWGHKPNTNYKSHPVANYNLKDYIFDKTLKSYKRKISSENKAIENMELNVKDYYMIKKFNMNRGANK